MVIASFMHIDSHNLHATHFLALTLATPKLSAGVCPLRISMEPKGHISEQNPHPEQRSMSTLATGISFAFNLLMDLPPPSIMASLGQIIPQAPQSMHKLPSIT
jgi:hypothetical protein